MSNSETGETNNSDRTSVSEGLSGVDLRIEKDHLKIGGLPTEFSGGMGTRNEPLKIRGIGTVRLDVTLRNTRYIIERIEGRGPKRTLFFTFNDKLLGVDSNGHVQLIRNKEKSEELFKWQIDDTKELLESMRGHEKDPDRWTLSVVDEE